VLETLLAEGRSYHDTESLRLAGELEAAALAPVAPPLLAKFLQLSTHTIGEHLGDWPRARRLAERVLEGQAATAETAMAWAWLSIARFLEGDAVQAAEAELQCLGAGDSDFRGALIETRFMLAAAMVGSGRTDEAAAIYSGALALARRAGNAAPARSVAVASNNLASELAEAVSRTPSQDALMETAAQAAHEFWKRCGTWVNEERALYLLALVANVLGRPSEALGHAGAALAIIEAHGDEPVDAAFLRLARARALGLSGDADGQKVELDFADAAASAWRDPSLLEWFARERAKSCRGHP